MRRYTFMSQVDSAIFMRFISVLLLLVLLIFYTSFHYANRQNRFFGDDSPNNVMITHRKYQFQEMIPCEKVHRPNLKAHDLHAISSGS